MKDNALARKNRKRLYEKKMKRDSFWIDNELKQKCKFFLLKRGISVSYYLNQCLDQLYKENVVEMEKLYEEETGYFNKQRPKI